MNCTQYYRQYSTLYLPCSVPHPVLNLAVWHYRAEMQCKADYQLLHGLDIQGKICRRQLSIKKWGMCWLIGIVHQTVKPAVLGSNPASLQPAGTGHSLLGSQQGWHDNSRLASEGRQRQKKYKSSKKKLEKDDKEE